MLLDKEVEITLKNNSINYYENLGYEIPRYIDKNGKIKVKRGTKIKVKVEDLSHGSNVFVNVQCDGIDCKNPYSKSIKYLDYIKVVSLREGKYYCKKCSAKLFRGEIFRLNWLKNGKSFEQWCIENKRQDVLDRWDYELNDCKPSEINYSTHYKYYFKCPKGLHKSESKNVHDFVEGHDKTLDCKACNSFAQWGMNNISGDFLEKYWDYERNKNIDPWKISKGAKNPKVWIKCLEKDYHESYDVTCELFIKGHRCSYCAKKKIHYFDSLGYLFPNVFEIWSEKNDKSPYAFSPNSGKDVYWKCPECKHEDYKRKINTSNVYNFRCPYCNFSRGEEKIDSYLISNVWNQISQDTFNKLNYNDNNKYYMPQKTFEGLVGLGNGLLSYDFFLPNLNLLIEYQGEQHEKYVKWLHKSKADFQKQLEHDRRKRKYAKNNNIRLLEIWYWDFDNIEKILDRELKEVVNS